VRRDPKLIWGEHPIAPHGFPTYDWLKLNDSRQPKVSALLRIFAGASALLWLVGVALDGAGHVCSCAYDEGACAGDASPVYEHDAVSPHEQRQSNDAEHHHEAEMHQHATASHHHDGATPQRCPGKNGCMCGCSTIQAFIATMTPVVIPQPLAQSLFNISLLCAAPQQVFAAPASETLRRAKPRNWVFTPEVCTGSANRSHAPPALT